MEQRIRSPINEKTSSIEKRLDKLAEDIRALSPRSLKKLEKRISGIRSKSLSIHEAAEVVGVHHDTIWRAIKSGSLKAFRVNVRGDWRISSDVMDSFLLGYKKRKQATPTKDLETQRIHKTKEQNAENNT